MTTADVQSVINETMATERAQMVQAVKNGKLTQAQTDLITAKKAEIKIATDKLKSMDQTERMATMKTQMDSLKQWATDNNIPEQYIMGFGGFGIGRGGERILGGQGFNKK